MIILGLYDGVDAGAALVVDNTLVAAVLDEPVRRRFGRGGLPSGAIDAVLDIAGLRPRDVDRVVLAGMLTPPLPVRLMPELRRRSSLRMREWHRAWQTWMRSSGLHMVELDAARAILTPRLRTLGFEKASLSFIEHDRAHSYAAYRSQPHDHVLILTVDTPGDGLSVSASEARHAQVDLYFRQSALAALSTLLQRVEPLIGGDLEALAALGTPDAGLVAAIVSEIAWEKGGFRPRPTNAPEDRLPGLAEAHSPATLAASVQRAIGDVLVEFVAAQVQARGVGRVCAAGELFRNAAINGRIAREAGVESFWVFPHPGDANLAIGAALGEAGVGVQRIPHPELGPRYTDQALYKALTAANLPRELVEAEATAAKLLAEGRTLARFSGPLEFSPVGLGNRTILCAADQPDVAARLAGALRTDRPLLIGAATLASAAPMVFPDLVRVLDAARFQSIALPPTADFARAYPGALRPDGLAQVQVVYPEDDPTFYRILAAYQQRTGQHTLATLTFRTPDEPVVCSPSDAIRTWRGSQIDYLLLGSYLVGR